MRRREGRGRSFLLRCARLIPQRDATPPSAPGGLTAWARGQAVSRRGLCALYTFAEGEGSDARDTSGAGLGLDLRLSDASRVAWVRGGGVEFTGSASAVTAGAAAKPVARLRKTNAVTVEASSRSSSAARRRATGREGLLRGDQGRSGVGRRVVFSSMRT
jgi:hypothetical protein